MKKTMIVLAALVMAATASNAQVYLGGSVGFSSDSYKPEGGEKTTSSRWNVNPTIGYYLNDRFDIGLDLRLNGAKDIDLENYFDNLTGTGKINGWAIAPFARYSFFRVGKWEVIAKLSAGFGGSKVEDSWDGDTDEYKLSDWGVDLAPVIAYNLTDKVVLYTTSSFATLGYYSVSEKNNDTKVGTFSKFGFNADATNVKNTGDIQIGFICKF